MQDQLRSVNKLVTLISVVFFLALPCVGLSLLQAEESSGLEPLTTCPRGTNQLRRMPLWAARPYAVHLPPSYDGKEMYPVVIDIHGGGGNKNTARLSTCPNQNPKSPACLDRVADCEGFIVVYPNGTFESPQAKDIRSFNAGGGADGYVCSSGYACEENIDDV